MASDQNHLQLLHRHAGNPILTAADWPYPINTIFNPAAIILADGSTLLLCRVEDRRGHSHLCAARSANGIDGWELDVENRLMPAPETHREELWGIEDPRITFLPELDEYAVVYTSYSSAGAGVSLALTPDFKQYHRIGEIMSPGDKDAALLPRRFNDHWVLIHRPTVSGAMGSHIWLSSSPDLVHWGNHKLILQARKGSWWDANKVGLSPPLIETDQGWLMFYHGVKETASGSIYRIGLALFDLENPAQCLARGDEWIFAPEKPYELTGDVDKVVFPCGYTLGSDGDTLNLYYGGADSCIALAQGSIKELLAWLEEHGTIE